MSAMRKTLTIGKIVNGFADYFVEGVVSIRLICRHIKYELHRKSSANTVVSTQA